MGRHDWYRKTTWTAQDEADFRSRLSRSRGDYNKAQYLRIQAYTLQETGVETNLRAALELLDQMFAQYPGEVSEAASGYVQMGECFDQLGVPDKAIEMYCRSLQCQRDHPNYRTSASLKLGKLVARHKYEELYSEALTALEEGKEHLLFPVQRFDYCTVLAFIMDDLGQSDFAARAAVHALEFSKLTESGFSYHKSMGIVTNPDEEVLQRLTRIANSGG